MMPERNKSPPKRGRLYRACDEKQSLPLHRVLYDHQRWLNSDGRFGKQLDAEELWFKDCDLEGMDFSRAHIEAAYFEGGSVRGARFSGAVLTYATFDSCNVEGVDFSQTLLNWSTFATNYQDAFFGDNPSIVAWSFEDRERVDRLRDKLSRSRFWLFSGGKPEPS